MRSAALFLFAGVALWSQTAHQHHPPTSSQDYARILNDPDRDEWQKPHEVVVALNLRRSDAVADIGAGTGYFARRFANHAGKVYAVDIDPNLLDIAAKGAPPNLVTVRATPDDPKLPAQSASLIFFCNVLHHIENRSAYYGKLKTALRPGGRIVIIDFYKKELPVGPPPSMKLSEEQVAKELEAAGFHAVRSRSFLPYQYFIEFEAK